MAKLVIAPPRVSPMEMASSRYRTLIDGRPAESIGPGRRIEIELEPGPHRIQARTRLMGSQPVDIDAGPAGTHLLAAGPSRRYNRLFTICGVAAALPQFLMMFWLMPRGVGSLDSGWFDVLFLPSAFLILLVQLATLVFSRDHSIELREIPDPCLTDSQIVVYLQAQPFRVRPTIRQMMVVVALVAVSLGGAVQWARRQRSSFFRSRASLHARLEEIARDAERGHLRYAATEEKEAADHERLLKMSEEASPRTTGGSARPARGPDFYRRMAATSHGLAARWRQSAARDTAKADYHASMKRKYEEAAARRALSVEPDPPEPPWP